MRTENLLSIKSLTKRYNLNVDSRFSSSNCHEMRRLRTRIPTGLHVNQPVLYDQTKANCSSHNEINMVKDFRFRKNCLSHQNTISSNCMRSLNTGQLCFNVYTNTALFSSKSTFFANQSIVSKLKRKSPHSFKHISRCNLHMVESSIFRPKTINEGTLLHFQSSGGLLRLARAVRPDGKRNWIVEDTNGLSLSITPKQVTYILGNPSDIPGLEELEQVQYESLQMVADNEELIEVAWEIVTAGGGLDETTTTNVVQIAEIVFDDISPVSLFAAHLLLSKDTIFFKQKNIKGNAIYEARTESIVRESQLLREAQKKKEEENFKKQKAFSESFTKESIELVQNVIPVEQFQQLVLNLKSIALELENGVKGENRNAVNWAGHSEINLEGRTVIKELMDAISKPISPLSAFEVLVAWGIFSKHENLLLLQPQMAERICELAEADSLIDDILANMPVDLDADRRVDYTHLMSFAIDSEDTTEIDDAISWDPESKRILIHIADPARYFPEGKSHPLIQHALRNVATLYLPDNKFTMFPKRLAETLFSLCGSSSDGSALSFSFEINSEGEIEQETTRIEPSRISAPVQLSYEDTKRILKDDTHEWHETLSNLLKLAELRRKWREMEGGAIIISNPFAGVSVKENNDEEPEIYIGLTDTESDSWTLVSELMIAACTVAATVAEKAKIAVPFRGQEPFDYPPDDVLEAIPNGTLRASIAFKNANPSEIKTHAIEHASLGLDAYLQVTSPIRRSNDLVTHFQLKAHLRGDSLPFAKENVDEDIARTMDLGRVMRNVENRWKRYWQHEQLRRWGPSRLYKGIFIRFLKDKELQKGFVHLHDYGFQVVAKISSDIAPGTEVEVKIIAVEPRTNFLSCEANTIRQTISKEELEDTLDDLFSDISSDSLE